MDINNLSQAEKDLLLSSLLDKMGGGSNQQSQGEQPKKSRKRKRKSKKHKGEPQSKTVQPPNTETIEVVGDDGIIHQQTRSKIPQGKFNIPITHRNKPPMFLETDPEVGAEDVEVDKKLWEQRGVTNRKATQKKISVVCDRCRQPDEVFPSAVTSVVGRKDGKILYICNSCSTGGR